MKTEFYQGARVADCEDNTNRQRCRELLAEILGRRKNSVELTAPMPLVIEVVRPPARVVADAPTPSPTAPVSPADPSQGTTQTAPAPTSAAIPTPPRGLTIRHLDGTETRSDG